MSVFSTLLDPASSHILVFSCRAHLITHPSYTRWLKVALRKQSFTPFHHSTYLTVTIQQQQQQEQGVPTQVVTARKARFPFLNPSGQYVAAWRSRSRMAAKAAPSALVVATRAADGGWSPGTFQHHSAPRGPRTARTGEGARDETTRPRSGRCSPPGGWCPALCDGRRGGQHRCLRCFRRNEYSSAPRSRSSTQCRWSRCSTTLRRRW